MKKRGNPKTDWTPEGSAAYDLSPICVKVLPGVKSKLTSIEGWREKTRIFWDELIESEGE